ncbi:MAG: prepilin-type N-terminal cleavage/methylation domain-containing protein [Desulfobacterales bacterium]|nr:prepilin-type N-terminal cleavage/methylation domain-containing protein [Desulfobacterales bacterium]
MEIKKFNKRGFTLIELLIVIAIIGALASAVTLVAPKLMEKGKVREAEISVHYIATGLLAFYTDMGIWPTYDNYVSGNETSRCAVGLLYTEEYGENKPESYPSQLTKSVRDTNLFTNEIKYLNDAIKNGWETDKRDLLDRHLQVNGANYKPLNNNKASWPYLERVGLDPWGLPYLININAFLRDMNCDDFKGEPGKTYTAWVISGGPNRIIDTPVELDSGETTDKSQPKCGNDDVCFLLGSTEISASTTNP